jgi:hypothetical protein
LHLFPAGQSTQASSGCAATLDKNRCIQLDDGNGRPRKKISMGQRPAAWPMFPAHAGPKPELSDPLLAQEDSETRTIIEHYLRLADSFLGGGPQEREEWKYEQAA